MSGTNAKKRYYDDWLGAYMDYSSKSEAPDKFHFWTGISAIAGALRRCVWIDQGYFEWTPNFYIIFVAPPGIVSKSTTASIGMNLLRQVPDIDFGPDAATWQALAMAFVEHTKMVTMPDGLDHPMSALTISSSEFGTFLNPNDREMVDLLVSMWDGQRGVWKKATKTMGDESIENPWINLIACTTPAWIAGTFPEYMIGGGFTSRCIFVYAEEKRHLVAYPREHLHDDFGEIEKRLVHDLEVISMLRGEYTITKEALAWGEVWYADLYAHRPVELSSERLAGYLARKQTHLHKLAMILSASRRCDMRITENDLAHADDVLSTIEADMPKVFSHIGQTDITRAANEIIRQVGMHNRIALDALYRPFMANMCWKEFQDALQSTIVAGACHQHSDGKTTYIIRNRDQEFNHDSKDGPKGGSVVPLKAN